MAAGGQLHSGLGKSDRPPRVAVACRHRHAAHGHHDIGDRGIENGTAEYEGRCDEEKQEVAADDLFELVNTKINNAR
jgi:hypothetical protein